MKDIIINRRSFILRGLGVLGIVASSGFWMTTWPEMGKLPKGERLEKIKKSPHYKNGKFHNLEDVEIMSNEKDSPLAKHLVNDKSKRIPEQPIISQKTDLKALDPQKDAVIWMGHSTFFIQIGGKRILTDPVFSDYASPLFCINRAFEGSNIYTADDFPMIDVLAISHDHWDHLDYPTVMALEPKIRNVVCPLGVGSHFEFWGFEPQRIHEEDWFTEIPLANNFSVHILPSQHFSGRTLHRNPTQWCGFAFVTPSSKVYYTGDGGYGSHFKEIGKRFGGFDLMLGENGQYNMAWHKIHMLPAETALAAVDVKAKKLIPAHGGKFALSRHPWQEPYTELTRESKGKPYELLTPELGEIAYINAPQPRKFDAWWERMS